MTSGLVTRAVYHIIKRSEANYMSIRIPMMSNDEIIIIENILRKVVEKNPGHCLEILEWGAGGSTFYFSNFLDTLGIAYSWISLEYNKSWATNVSNEVKDNPKIKVVLFDIGNNEVFQRGTNMDGYVNYPSTLGKKFDFILVDGRKRRRSVIEAKTLVSDNGIIILHDAERPYYHCALEGGQFISKRLWMKE